MKANLLTGALIIEPANTEECARLESLGILRCITRFDSQFFPALDQCAELLEVDLPELYRDFEFWDSNGQFDEQFVRSGEGYGYLMLTNYVRIDCPEAVEDVQRRFGPHSDVAWVGHGNGVNQYPMARETINIPITFEAYNRAKSLGQQLADEIRNDELTGVNA